MLFQYRTIRQIHALGVKVSVALNPATPLLILDWVLHEVDMVLLMTVNPGFGGQKSIPYIIEKITELHNRIIKENLNMDIQVDEGISEKNIEQVMKAGANIFVAGSAIFGQDVEKNTSIFLQKIKIISNRRLI